MTSAKHTVFYPPEFRAETVRLARTSGKLYAQIARDLGMATETLRKWLKQADLDEGKRQGGLTTEEREELKVQQKVSGCFRSTRGGAAFGRIRSYLSSLRKQGMKRLAALEPVFAGQLLYPAFG